MKDILSRPFSLRKASCVLLIVLGVMGMSSCDKASELSEKVSSLWDSEDLGNYDSEVSDVTEQEGKAIISEETRMVLLEFYSDT